MFRTLITCFRISELRNKLLFTLGMLGIYRVGFWVALPGVDQQKMAGAFGGGDPSSPFSDIASYFAMFTGGSLQQSTIFGLGIMPYISASIIFQLLATVVPALEKLQKEGEAGRRKIQEYTRYATVGLCIMQSIFWLNYVNSQGFVSGISPGWFWAVGILAMTTGTLFLMWLGEQIDEYGIGNGVSLIITAGILSQMPQAIGLLMEKASPSITSGEPGDIGPGKILFLIVAFVLVVAGAICITQGQRRIPIQQQKMMRGRRVYGGQRQYLPLRVNHGGVMPIIFAQSLMMFPSLLFESLSSVFPGSYFVDFLADSFRGGGNFPYLLTYIAMVYFFAYFWTTVQFQPKEIANQLRDSGHFILGLRPGRRTAEYLERVMERITYVGAGFLSLIAVIPTVVGNRLDIPMGITTYLGGTGLLIVVSVLLDLVTRIEAQLIMRNYSGFLGDEGAGRIKGAYT
jgi:preprotein translocase subunit SecY